MRATGKARPQLYRTPTVSGKPWNVTTSSPCTFLGFPALGRPDGRGRGQVQKDLQSEAHARQNAPPLSAVRGQDGLHSQRRNLHGKGQGLPLAPPRISRQCCLSSHGYLTGRQQEPHAVHGPFLELCHAMLKNEMGVLAIGTVMQSRNYYPKELSKRLTERDRYEFR